jgi:hypothetical protein
MPELNPQDPQGQNPTPPVVPPENRIAELERKEAESRRRAEEAERERDMLRDMNLRSMAQPVAPTPPPQEEDDEEEINNLFATSPAQAMKKLLNKAKGGVDKTIEEKARRIFQAEAKKLEAMNRFPELKNPKSEFFRKVAFFMDTHPEKYNDPEGLIDACARVTFDMGKVPDRPVPQASENMRNSVSNASAHIEGSGNAPVGEKPELDARGLELAAKLGIEPSRMASRLKDLAEGKGDYAPQPGKTGKATFKKE